MTPYIDSSKIPAPGASYSSDRVMAANVADAGQRPTPDTIGAFREPCAFSHMAYDDPIVYPGRPGVSHLHTFFGNTGANAHSTAASIAGSGNSTCAGGTLNRTAYWVPSMIDTADGRPIAPTNSLIYYKTGYLGVKPVDVKAIPNGLRLIAGNSASTGPQAMTGFACVGNGDNNRYDTIPACPAGSDVVQSIAFPQCWDGVNLDSPDHKSHMAYAWGGCPSTHPVALPEIAFQIHYKVTAESPPTRWRLSSDNYDTSKPGGYSSHADWFMGWNEAIMQTFTRSCLNASADCHAYLIGDGRMVY